MSTLTAEWKIFDEDNNTIYATEAELSSDLKNNFIKNIGVLLSYNSRLVASSAKSIKEPEKTIYSNVVFTKCKSCNKTTDKSVMWKLKAKKATHLKKSKIILLDEATSSLDAETEQKIQDAINYLTKGRTTLVIAHRLSTILKSNKIYVIDNGKVTGEGKNDELLKNSEIYKNFYEKQIQKH